MDTTTSFDLNQAFEHWRQSVATHEAITGERAAELESHLRDTCAELRERGLTAEESFWLAARRVGEPSTISEQFACAAPTGVWRTRIFWMAIGMLVIPCVQQLASVVSGVASFAFSLYASPTLGGLMALVLPLSLIGGMLWLLAGLAMGRWPALAARLELFFSRGPRFAWKLVLFAFALLVVRGAAFVLPMMWFQTNGPFGWAETRNGIIAFQGLNLLWPIALAVLAAAYAPKRLSPLSTES